MSEPSETQPSPNNYEDAGKVHSEAVALAQHLQQSGVQWIPIPEKQEVNALAQHFRIEPADTSNEMMQSPSKGVSTENGITQNNLDSTTAQNSQSAMTDKPKDASRDTQVGPASTANNTTLPVVAIDGPYPGAPVGTQPRQTELKQLADQVAKCERCPVLSEKRTTTVFGEGNFNARIVFFGEAPGADEDRIGRPFIGKAGELLTKMIEACKLSRDDVYILNTIKCRPPGNRNPELEERSNCREYYQAQLNAIRPEYIVCLGAVAAQELLQNKASVGSMRGKFHRYHTSKVLVTYHPAYLLREPTRKRAAWQDLQMMLQDAKIEY